MHDEDRVTAASSAALGAIGSALTADAITIGQVAHLTGYGAEGFGRPTNWGSQIGMTEVKNSKLLGSTEINLVSLDDASDPTVAITSFNKLAQQKITITTGTAISRICSAIDPVAKQTTPKTFLICIGGTGVGTQDTKPPYVSLNEPSTPMANLARYTIAKKGAKKIAAIFDTDNAASFDSMSAGFLNGMKAEGINDYVTVQKISQKDTDFSSMLTNLQQVQPDAIVFYAIASQSGNIILQMTQMGGFEKVVKAGHVGWTGQVPQIAGPAATGVLLTQAWIASPASQNFVDAYKKLSNGAAPTSYSALGHDAMWMLATAAKLAIAKGKAPNGESVEAELLAATQSEDFKNNSLVGPDLQCDRQNRRAGRRHHVRRQGHDGGRAVITATSHPVLWRLPGRWSRDKDETTPIQSRPAKRENPRGRIAVSISAERGCTGNGRGGRYRPRHRRRIRKSWGRRCHRGPGSGCAPGRAKSLRASAAAS